MIEINKSLCVGCGSCVKDCTAKVLKLIDDKAVWTKDCLHCGHCVAICPTNAVSIPEYDMDDVAEFDKDEFEVTAANYLNSIKFRRSIRDFKPNPIEKDKLQRILNAGRYSPTANNIQGTKFILIQDRLDEFKELVWKDLPNAIEVINETFPSRAAKFARFYEAHCKNPQNDTLFFNTTSFLVIATENEWDAGIASANIENMAAYEGAGVLYSGYMKRIINASPVLKDWLGIEDNHVSCCLLLGYPNVSYKRTAPRKHLDVDWR